MTSNDEEEVDDHLIFEVYNPTRNNSFNFVGRHVGAAAIIIAFFLYFLSLGIGNEVLGGLDGFALLSRPDFDQYRHMRTLTTAELDNPKRLILVGDIHGRKDSLDVLLRTVQYKSDKDTLIHVGDIISKGPIEGSLATLSYMTEYNVTGVRGNHDQKVLQWKAWRDWVLTKKGGVDWLHKMEKQSKHEIKAYMKKHKGKKWKQIPDEWSDFMDDHYQIARNMTRSQHEYLLSLPLVLHLPNLHSYVVHAGILPQDPRYPSHSSRQPLARPPKRHHYSPALSMRHLQELSILHDIPQNNDPWTLINMRSILDNKDITRDGDVGTPWSDEWNRIVKLCDGYYFETIKDKSLSCRPMTVIYGHAASRGLDIKRWSLGLDSGCVYNRRLSALIVSASTHTSRRTHANRQVGGRAETDKPETDKRAVPFGDDGQAEVVSVVC